MIILEPIKKQKGGEVRTKVETNRIKRVGIGAWCRGAVVAVAAQEVVLVKLGWHVWKGHIKTG